MSTWGADHDAPWRADRPAPLDPVEEALLRLDYAYRYRHDDPLSAARGCLFGTLLSLPLWALLAGAAWLVARLVEAVAR